MEGKKISAATAARVAVVRHQIELWRSKQAKGSRMPQGLWAAAVELALECGTYRIARALGLNYQRLKDHIARPVSGSNNGVAASEFVEFSGAIFSPSGTGSSVVELCDSSGQRLVIRLSPGQAVDVAGLAEGFWRRGQP